MMGQPVMSMSSQPVKLRLCNGQQELAGQLATAADIIFTVISSQCCHHSQHSVPTIASIYLLL